MPSHRGLLVVGAGKWHVPLYQAARDLRLEIVATHWKDKAAGFAFADHSYVLDARDKRGHLELARRHRVAGVVTAADLAVPTAAYVAHELRLPGIAEDVALANTDKGVMRRRAQSLGLGGPNFATTHEVREALLRVAEIGFPCIVKPADGWGSRGVTVAECREQLIAAYGEAVRFSSSGEILVEELMQGVECSVEGFVDSAGNFKVLGISDKAKSPLPYRFDLELHYPGRFSPTQMSIIESFVETLVRGLGVTMGLTHTELMVHGATARLIETAARGCGAFVVAKLLPAMSGVPLLHAAIRQTLGEPVELPLMQSRHGLLKFITLPPGTVTRCEGIEVARTVPGVIDLDLEISVGERVEPATNTQGRKGQILVIGESRQQVDRIAATALGQLHVEVSQ